MKYYLSMGIIQLMVCIAICVGTLLYASFYDPEAEALVRLFVNCVVKILSLGN